MTTSPVADPGYNQGMRSVLAIALLALLSCTEETTMPDDPRPRVEFLGPTCGRSCFTNTECAGDILGRCRFCTLGTCRDTLPAQPGGSGGSATSPTR